MEDIKIIATYRNGTLIPSIPLDLKDGTEVEVVLHEDLYSAFSLASEDDTDVENYISAQNEAIQKSE